MLVAMRKQLEQARTAHATTCTNGEERGRGTCTRNRLYALLE